jgi:hypothetical protein
MSTTDKIKASLYSYLNQEFGPGFTNLNEPPEGVKIGEWVIYLLESGQNVQWAGTEQANREYDVEFEFAKGREISQQLKSFAVRQASMAKMVETQPD